MQILLHTGRQVQIHPDELIPPVKNLLQKYHSSMLVLYTASRISRNYLIDYLRIFETPHSVTQSNAQNILLNLHIQCCIFYNSFYPD